MPQEQEIKVSGNYPVTAKDENGKDVDTGQKVSRQVSFNWNTPNDLEEMKSMWGEDTAFQLAMQKGIIKAQDKARRELGKNASFTGAELINYIPEIGRRVSGKPRKPESLEADFEKLSQEDQLALIERLRAKLASGDGQTAPAAEPVAAEEESVSKGKRR